MSLPKLAEGADAVDITLLLEGTYPYVRGGVSSWVYQLIEALSELRFAVVFVGSQPSDYEGLRYEMPKNLVHFEEHYLMQAWSKSEPKTRRGNAEAFRANDEMHQALKTGSSDQAQRLLCEVARLMKANELDRKDFLNSEESWNQISDYYRRYCADPSFVDYFWTVRTTHAPLFDLMDIARSLPKSRVLHAISTGYAGFLGALAHQLHGTPFLLTEHGIYIKERRIDLAQADWIVDTRDPMGSTQEQDISYMRQMWINFFEGLGRMTYRSAEAITALYEGNRRRQVADGAEPARTRVIPNGIDLARFSALRAHREPGIPPVLGLIGRVVPIKDIKTFIRAMRTVCNRMPAAEGWIVGPIEEDEAYARECHALVAQLGLQSQIKFLGFKDVAEILPKIGLLILSSISEAQPLVVLEGFAAGVPAVTTDVGCCAGLIEGISSEDRAFGKAGEVVPIASPALLAEAALRLLENPAVWQAAQRAGIQRVETFYGEDLMFARFRELYGQVARATEVRGAAAVAMER